MYEKERFVTHVQQAFWPIEKMTNDNENLCCRLTTPELQKRKATVLLSLQSKMTDRVELTDGYSFRFDGNDETLDELNEFVKTERMCCPFFTFTVIVNGETRETWLHLTGPGGVKTFIKQELGFY